MSDDRREGHDRRENPPSLGVVHQMVVQNHETCEKGHKSLRDDVNGHDQRLDAVEETLRLNGLRLQKIESGVENLEKTPIEIAKLRLSPATVAAIVAAFVSVLGAQYALNAGVRSELAAGRSDVRDILTKMAASAQVEDARVKLQDERAAALKSAVEAVTRQQQLQAYEIQRLNETIAKGGKR